MDSLISENLVAMGIIAIVMICSKRVALPAIILAYYIVYIILDVSFVNQWNIKDAITWYMVMASLDLTVMIACLAAIILEKTYVRTTFVYMVYVGIFNLIPDLMQANFITTEIRYLSTAFYKYIMSYAISFEIIITIIGSDNFVSRKLFKKAV